MLEWSERLEVYTVGVRYRDEEGGLHDATGFPLMQFTGLNDKSGKEIYEGDIVRWPRGRSDDKISAVEWDIELARFIIDLYSLTDARDYKVIGNIYENPELLQ